MSLPRDYREINLTNKFLTESSQPVKKILLHFYYHKNIFVTVINIVLYLRNCVVDSRKNEYICVHMYIAI